MQIIHGRALLRYN